MMESIYHIPLHTVIYLGNSDGHIDALFEEIAQIELERRSDHHHTSVSRPRTVLIGFPSSKPFELAARELLARPWFYRGWIVQELPISRDPWEQCGSSRIRWELFCKYLQTRGIAKALEAENDSVEIMPEKRPGGSVSFNVFKYLHSARIAYQKGAIEGKPAIGLLNLLISPRRVEFTDARDIIFGYMGVAKSPFIGEFSERYPPPNSHEYHARLWEIHCSSLQRIYSRCPPNNGNPRDLLFRLGSWSVSAAYRTRILGTGLDKILSSKQPADV